MEFTKEQIERYKQQWGRLHVYETTTDDRGVSIYNAKGELKEGCEVKSCLLKSPSLQVLDACQMSNGGSTLKFNEMLVENCWVDGDVELKTVDVYREGLYRRLGLILRCVDGELKEV